MSDAALVIMAKRPAVDETKSRLSPPLTPAQAAALYEALLRDTIELAAGLDRVQLAIALTPEDAVDYFQGITPSGTILLPIVGTDIGDCLRQALSQLLDEGYSRVAAIHSDGPTLPSANVRRALAELRNPEIDVVLGPSEDGGYYLIGLKEPHPELFEGIAWSTDRVTPQTLSKIEALGLRVAELPYWYDVDTADELDRLLTELATLPDDALPHTRRVLNESWQGDSARAVEERHQGTP